MASGKLSATVYSLRIAPAVVISPSPLTDAVVEVNHTCSSGPDAIPFRPAKPVVYSTTPFEATGLVGSEVACVTPPAFSALTTTSSVSPTYLYGGEKVDFVAPAIFSQVFRQCSH